MRTSFLAFALLVGCGGSGKPASTGPGPAEATPAEPAADGQTFAAAIKLWCDAPADASVQSIEATNRPGAIIKMIETGTTNKEALDLWATFAEADVASKRAAMLEATTKAGIAEADCALLSIWSDAPTP